MTKNQNIKKEYNTTSLKNTLQKKPTPNIQEYSLEKEKSYYSDTAHAALNNQITAAKKTNNHLEIIENGKHKRKKWL